MAIGQTEAMDEVRDQLFGDRAETGADGIDRLGRALHSLRMRSTFYCHADLSEPWALEMPAIADSLSFHVVTAGSCRLEVPGHGILDLGPGDLALVPHGRGHTLRAPAAAGPALRVDLLPQDYSGPNYSHLRRGGGGRPAQLICGVVGFDEPAARELVRRLPDVVVLHGDDVRVAAALRDTLRLMAGELARPQPGGEAVATRLADILVVQAIRTWLAEDPRGRAGWLLALQDDRVGAALEAVHAAPGQDWTVEALARVATMSRSAFSARFTELTGESPAAYLTRWRMAVAHARLRDGGTTVAQVAGDLGYGSQAAFTRAFVRVVGVTPGAVRSGAETGQTARAGQTAAAAARPATRPENRQPPTKVPSSAR